MKLNNKKKLSIKYFFASILLSIFSLNINADYTTAIEKWHKDYGDGFEIQNKTNVPVTFKVNTQQKIETYNIGPNSKKATKISPDAPLEMIVYIGNSTSPDFKYNINAKGKTKYLTWNPAKYYTPAKYLYPQTGPIGGWTGKSESGNSLANNVTQADIKYQSRKE